MNTVPTGSAIGGGGGAAGDNARPESAERDLERVEAMAVIVPSTAR